jgi:uncharacterized protein with GYD domain
MNYQLHDISRFPFVALRSDRCVPGFAVEWGQEMDALLAARTPFVVAFEPAAIAETPEDFRERAQWFKANRKQLGGNCAAMVAVVPSADQRQALAADLAKRSRGFDVRYVALESFAVAESQTPAFIAQDQAERLASAA